MKRVGTLGLNEADTRELVNERDVRVAAIAREICLADIERWDSELPLQVGEHVRVDRDQGKIVALDVTHVWIRTAAGRNLIRKRGTFEVLR